MLSGLLKIIRVLTTDTVNSGFLGRPSVRISFASGWLPPILGASPLPITNRRAWFLKFGTELAGMFGGMQVVI